MSVQKYRVFQSRLIAIDDDSMFNRDCHSVVVTHADYRALEDESAYFRKEWNKAEGKIASLEEELASIKARVGEGK